MPRPPSSSRFPFLDHPGPLAFAHRGGAGSAPENTMAAFEAAVRLGYRYVETDVRTTADGVLVVFHDARLDRATDRVGRLAELPWSEASRVRVHGRQPLPRLEELLGEWPHLRVNIDLKEAAALAPLAEVVRRTRAHDRVCIASFSERRLRAARRALGPRVCTSLGPLGATRLWCSALSPGLRSLVPSATPCAQLPPYAGRLPVVTGRLVEVAHSSGMQVHAWTVDDAAEMHRLLDLGVDGLVTDEPALLREVLRSRGAWSA